MYSTFLFIQRLFGFFLGVFLVYSTLKLLNELKNKEIAISMVFLHKKRVINLFGLLVISGFITWITALFFVFIGNNIFVELLLNLNAVVLLIFVYFLQKIMKGGK